MKKMKKEFMEQLINNCKSEIEQYIQANRYNEYVDLLASIKSNESEIFVRVWNGKIYLDNIVKVKMKQRKELFKLHFLFGTIEKHSNWLNSKELDTYIKQWQDVIIKFLCGFIEDFSVR